LQLVADGELRLLVLVATHFQDRGNGGLGDLQLGIAVHLNFDAVIEHAGDGAVDSAGGDDPFAAFKALIMFWCCFCFFRPA